LLGVELDGLPPAARNCLQQLDQIANHVEDATLLAVNNRNKEACQVLLVRLMPAIEKWLGLTSELARALGWDPNENHAAAEDAEAISLKKVAKFAHRASSI